MMALPGCSRLISARLANSKQRDASVRCKLPNSFSPVPGTPALARDRQHTNLSSEFKEDNRERKPPDNGAPNIEARSHVRSEDKTAWRTLDSCELFIDNSDQFVPEPENLGLVPDVGGGQFLLSLNIERDWLHQRRDDD